MTGRRVIALMLLVQAAAAGAQGDTLRSGFEFMSRATQALRNDDTQNPAMLWLAEGERLWQASAKPCASCRGPSAQSMRGVAARYPAFDERSQRAITLGQRINSCRTRHQVAAPWARENQSLPALETLVGHASRGLPLAPPADLRLTRDRALGEHLFGQRFGQLDFSCTMCHDQLAGYPIFRLEWQGMGLLQRRLRGCLTGLRAEPWAADAPQWVALELHLAQRAAGMAIETPAVRP